MTAGKNGFEYPCTTKAGQHTIVVVPAPIPTFTLTLCARGKLSCGVRVQI
jgi:hypothetical protein